MLRPKQEEGEFENFVTIELIAFKSRFILFYFVYPNTHLLGLASQILPYKQVESVVRSCFQPLLLAYILWYCYFPVFI